MNLIEQADAAHRATTWQPIATAPRDNRERVLLFVPPTHVSIGFWSDICHNWMHDYGDCPTHWMRLPPPPAGKEGA